MSLGQREIAKIPNDSVVALWFRARKRLWTSARPTSIPFSWTKYMLPSEQNSSSQSIAAAVKDLMRRKQVPERQHGKKLGEILGLSYSQAHRKLNTGANWTIAQLQQVAEHFGESLVSIGVGDGSASAAATPGAMVEGRFVVAAGQYEYPCVAWLGDQLHTARRVDFVAYQADGIWRIVDPSQCPANSAQYKLNRLEIVLKYPEAPTVAILGDKRNAVELMREVLNGSGIRTTTFQNATSLERTLHEGAKFDGYVLDWIIGPRTTEGLIKQIRYLPGPVVPVFVLTEEAASGQADQEELARVINQLDVKVRENPIRLRTFTAELHKALGD